LAVRWRRARNELHGVLVNGWWCKEKDVVKEKVREFFEARFVKKDVSQLRLDNDSFNSISGEDNEMLVDVFNEEEIKETIWSCDSMKSPGLDDFNFGFIKFCWDVIKKDVVSAVKDFAINGKWPKG